MPLTTGVGLTMVKNQQEMLKRSAKMCFSNLEHMFKSKATDLNKKLTPVKQRLTCALKNARFVPDGFCCLSDTGNKILFVINCQ